MRPRPSVTLSAGAMRGHGRTWSSARIVALCCFGALAVVLLPYFVLGPSFEDGAAAFLDNQSSRVAVAGLGVLLLAADMVLPVPSSVVATALGVALGWLPGMLAAAAGLSIGCVLGFVLGRSGGRRLVRTRPASFGGHVPELLLRYGVIVLVLCRGVPIVAEASVMAAGALGMSAWRCLTATTLANLGVGAVYAGAGAAVWDVSPAVAFLAALLLPGLFLAFAAGARRLWAHPARSAAGGSPT
jgi:uncharacterized membrane protein YdjX (TVP38/TMEM64 family)